MLQLVHGMTLAVRPSDDGPWLEGVLDAEYWESSGASKVYRLVRPDDSFEAVVCAGDHCIRVNQGPVIRVLLPWSQSDL